jgi:hypothetical protein
MCAESSALTVIMTKQSELSGFQKYEDAGTHGWCTTYSEKCMGLPNRPSQEPTLSERPGDFISLLHCYFFLGVKVVMHVLCISCKPPFAGSWSSR